MYTKSGFLTFRERKLLCSALLQYWFDYRYHVYYGGLEKSLKTKLRTAQNKMGRYILGCDSWHHLVCNDLSKLKALDVSSWFECLQLHILYSICNKFAPWYFMQFSKGGTLTTLEEVYMSDVIPHVNNPGSNSCICIMLLHSRLILQLGLSLHTVKTCLNHTVRHYFNKMVTNEESDFVV